MTQQNNVVVVTRGDLYLCTPTPAAGLSWSDDIDSKYVQTFATIESARKAFDRRAAKAGVVFWGGAPVTFACRIPKPKEYVVQGKYPGPHGWEDLVIESTREDAAARLHEYDDNEPMYPHRIITRRTD